MLDPVFEGARGDGKVVWACGWVGFRDEAVAGGEVERVFFDDACRENCGSEEQEEEGVGREGRTVFAVQD